MLMDEHTNADSAHVEPIKEVLCPLFQCHIVVSEVLLHLQNALRHSLNDCPMTIANHIQSINKSANDKN